MTSHVKGPGEDETPAEVPARLEGDGPVGTRRQQGAGVVEPHCDPVGPEHRESDAVPATAPLAMPHACVAYVPDTSGSHNRQGRGAHRGRDVQRKADVSDGWSRRPPAATGLQEDGQGTRNHRHSRQRH